MDKKLLSSIRSAAFKRNALRIRISNARPQIRIKSKENQKTRFRQGWREFGGKRVYFRSKWEANFGRYLEWQKERNMIKDWEHEPKTFWFDGVKRGAVSYLPDFRVTNLDESQHWVEVKGYMDPKSATKIKRFNKYFPQEKLVIVDKKWYNLNSKKLSLLIKGWEI